MTSEGQQAGQQPAEATSGSPAETFGPDGFPPDSGPQHRGSAHPGQGTAQPSPGFPTSYAPPPQSTPNGGSPFVVPTVFGQPGERPVPDGAPADRTTPPSFAPPASGYTPPPSTGSARVTGSGSSRVPGASLPQRDNGGSASAWASPEQPGSTGPGSPFGPSAEPHPYRPGEGDSGEIAGFAPGSPTRGRAGLDDDENSGGPYALPDRSPFGSGADQEPPNGSRPPGVSAFGDQRVRVPGATLTDLPDGPPSIPAARDEFTGGGVTRREGDGSALPRRTAPTGDPLLSFGSTADSFQGFQPTGRGSGEAPESRGSSSYTPRASQAFGASRNAGAAFGGQPGESPAGGAPGESPFERRTAPRQAGEAASPSGPTSDSFQFGSPPAPSGSPFDQPPTGGSPFGETVAGGPFAAPPPSFDSSESSQPFGTADRGFGPAGQDGRSAEPYGSAAPDGRAAGRQDGRPFEPGADSPFVQRVPGASFGTPAAAAASGNGGSGNGASGSGPASGPVLQPREAAERPAVGTARPVSASASVPTASRVAPVDAEEIPSAPAAPQARVYGRAAPATDDDTDRDDRSMYARPSRDDQPASPVAPYGDQRARSTGEDEEGLGGSPYGRRAGEPGGDDRHSFGRFGAQSDDDAQVSPFGRPPGADQNGQAPYGRRSVDDQGRSSGDDEDGPFGRPADGEQQGPRGFGAEPATPFGPRGGPGSPLGPDAQPASPFGSRRDQGTPFTSDPDPDSPFGGRGNQDPRSGSRGDSESPFGARPDQGSPFGGRAAASADQNDGPGDRQADQNGSGSYGRGAGATAYSRLAADDDDSSDGFGPAPFGQRGQSDQFARPGQDDESHHYGQSDQFGQPGQRDEFGRPGQQNGQVGQPGPQGDSFGRPGGDRSGGFGAAPVSPYGRGSEDDQNGPGGFGPAEARPPAGAPPLPARASGRATASARVTPPAPSQATPGQPIPGQPIPGQPMPGQPMPGPGQAAPGQPAGATPADHYGEHTTDISRRGQADQPYVPAPALPSLHARPPLENGFPAPADGTESPDRMRMGGVFPGPAGRSTVTPPNPDETTSWPRPGESEQGAQTSGWPRPGEPDQGPQGAAWPNPGEPDQRAPGAAWPHPGESDQGAQGPSWPHPGTEPEQGRFDQFKPEAATGAVPATPATPHVRMLPIILGVIIGAALLVGLPTGIVWLISRGSDSGGISVSAGDCVKRSGSEAIKATCGDPGTFQVASVADSKDKCADPTQPYVVNPTKDGKSQVLCLKPSS